MSTIKVNRDLRMIKSFEKERPLKNTISEGILEKSITDELNEQGMMISKISNNSWKENKAENLRDGDVDSSDYPAKMRAKSGIPRPKRQLTVPSQPESTVVPNHGLMNFHSVKPDQNKAITKSNMEVRDVQAMPKDYSSDKEDSQLVQLSTSKIENQGKKILIATKTKNYEYLEY